MKLFEQVFTRHCKYKHIWLIIIILSLTIINSGCNRKVGVKPGGKVKTDTSKCKCKKRKSIYAEVSNQESYFFNFESCYKELTKV